jgi:hypothetical protein
MIDNNEFVCKNRLKLNVDKTLNVSINVWKKLRAPFIFPCRIASHICDTHWEKINIDCAGCKQCGSIHICHGGNTVVTQNDKSIDMKKCVISAEHDADVCIITGLCLHDVRYSEHEVVEDVCKQNVVYHKNSNVLPENNHKIKNNNFKSRNKSFKSMSKSRTDSVTGTSFIQPNIGVCGAMTKETYSIVEGCCVLEYSTILTICQYILCSDEVMECFRKERVKLASRVRCSFMKHIRQLKKNNRKTEPVHALSIIGDVADDLFNYRLFAQDGKTLTHSLEQTRCTTAEVCARIITTFINNANGIINNFMYNVSPKTFIVGVLYLLRVGLTAHHIVLLPEQRILAHILPSENLLHEFFGVKCKCITEVENIIKLQVRMLTMSQLLSMQYTE